MVAIIRTDEELETEVAKQSVGTGAIPQVTETLQDATQVDDLSNISIGATTPVAATETAVPTNIRPTAPVQDATGQVAQTTTVSPNITTLDAAQIQRDQPYITDIPQGTVSEGSITVAPTQDLDEKATTKYQLEQLLSSLEDGTEPPAWASPAIRKVTAIMQSRGMGASSMAAAAMTQAVMESGIVIATQDANKYATIQLQNLNGQQKVALQNALTYASMDKSNLSARLQAAVTNAQGLLSVDVKNLDAQQKSDLISYNALTQGLFKDAAEDNARQQFNAKNQLQVDQFFSELEAQVETANANRVSALAQFNAGEANAQNQFNASIKDARDKFDANMQFAVDQSNVQWRRQVNTANTALQNETNRINTQNQFNASQNALNNLWQKYRDNASWNFQKSESMLQRQHEIGIMAMEFANSKEIYDKEQKDNLALGVGNWIAAWMGAS